MSQTVACSLPCSRLDYVNTPSNPLSTILTSYPSIFHRPLLPAFHRPIVNLSILNPPSLSSSLCPSSNPLIILHPILSSSIFPSSILPAFHPVFVHPPFIHPPILLSIRPLSILQSIHHPSSQPSILSVYLPILRLPSSHPTSFLQIYLIVSGDKDIRRRFPAYPTRNTKDKKS